MLVLARHENQDITITDELTGDEIVIKAFDCFHGKVKLGIECPEHFSVIREESTEQVRARVRENTALKVSEIMAHRAPATDLRTFGSMVVEARTQAGLSTTELSSRLGVSQSTLSRIESGNREPRLEIIRMLCEQLPALKGKITGYLDEGKF